MNTSPTSIIITIFLWYIAIGIYHLIYLGITKKIKDLDWKKFILETLGLVFIYFLTTLGSIFLGGNQSVALFSILNIILLFALIFLYSKYIMKLELLSAVIFSLVFVMVFNLYWYILFGIL